VSNHQHALTLFALQAVLKVTTIGVFRSSEVMASTDILRNVIAALGNRGPLPFSAAPTYKQVIGKQNVPVIDGRRTPPDANGYTRVMRVQVMTYQIQFPPDDDDEKPKHSAHTCVHRMVELESHSITV
jgi:hypothetical protein